MRRAEIARNLLAAALLLHFGVLALNALPWSRFVAALYPYYGWYPRWTGQNQAWAMYQYPDHGSSEFELVARFADGREERPWGDARAMSSRRMYFLENLFVRDDGERLAQGFLTVLRARWPERDRPTAIVIRRTTRAIRAYAESTAGGALDGRTERREIARRW